jgi:hypothetical protein
MQINHFLPFFLCSVNLIFNKLFCNSFLPLSVQQVCSASHSSVILLFFCSAYRSVLFLLYISSHSVYLLNFILCIFSSLLSYCFVLFLFRTANPIQSLSFSFIHSALTVPLPLPMGNPRTSVLETETLTDLSLSVCFS